VDNTTLYENNYLKYKTHEFQPIKE